MLAMTPSPYSAISAGLFDSFQPLPAGLHIVGGHTAGLMAEPGQFREGKDVDNGIPQGFGAPGHFPPQLLRRKLEGGADGGVEDFVVLFRQPAGSARQVNLSVQLQGGNQFPGKVADDDFIVHHRYRRRHYALAFEESLGFGFAGNVVVLILNTVRR